MNIEIVTLNDCISVNSDRALLYKSLIRDQKNFLLQFA